MSINLFLQKLKHLFVLIILISLTACATMTTRQAQPIISQPNSAWIAQQNKISMISNWTIQGRMAVKTAQQGGSASVFWQQQGNRYSLELFGPLGAGAVYLQGIPGQITLNSSRDQHLQAATPELLMRRALGWNVPVTNLKYWIRGIPVRNQPMSTSFNNQGQLSQLMQSGWQINYLTYMTVNNLYLPQQMTLVGQGLMIKIIIDNWKLN